MTHPDIILIVLDTQRVDRLGTYGYHRPISPNLDRFAAEGAVFEGAISPAQWTIPSHASMFTGLYPTAHGLTQSHQRLNDGLPHLAELLQEAGYQTIGFCNNPLVGILNNGLKRGFETFYNYGGAIPSVPSSSSHLPWPLNVAAEHYTQFLRRLSYPIQNFFGRSDLAFRLSLNTWLTPLWSKLANFKGQNERSVADVVHFLDRREREKEDSERPLFLFLNLMETHLPFWPSGRAVEQVAPYMLTDREARTTMRRWNREAYRWAAPLAEPLSELEQRVLSDMYDAEVAYQDGYLGPLFALLDQRRGRENTLTIILSDHGDGLGEHGYFGHAFVAYQELVHIPLILHWPGQIPPSRPDQPVSARRVFHTALEAAGVEGEAIRRLTLRHSLAGNDPEEGVACAEVYPPMNFVKAIASRQPDLLESFRCLANRRAIVRGDHKLIRVDGRAEELYDLSRDPDEAANLLADRPDIASRLDAQLARFVAQTTRQHEALALEEELDLESNEQIARRLRGLGYIE